MKDNHNNEIPETETTITFSDFTINFLLLTLRKFRFQIQISYDVLPNIIYMNQNTYDYILWQIRQESENHVTYSRENASLSMIEDTEINLNTIQNMKIIINDNLKDNVFIFDKEIKQMETLYTYTAYTGEEIIDYIDKHPNSLFAKECIRKYYVEDPSGLYCEPTLVNDKLYYIIDYKPYWIDSIIGEHRIDSYKILRLTRAFDKLEIYQPKEIK